MERVWKENEKAHTLIHPNAIHAAMQIPLFPKIAILLFIFIRMEFTENNWSHTFGMS